MKYKSLLFLLLIPLLWSATLLTNKPHKLGFEIKNFGVMVDGTMSGFNGELTFNPHFLDAAQFNFTLDVKTLKTGMPERDKDLLLPEYFNASKFPHIHFNATEFIHVENDNYEAVGTLKIKGVSKRVKVPFTYIAGTETDYIRGEVAINRRDFGVGKKIMIMDDWVRVAFYLPLDNTKSIYTGR